VIFDEKFPFTVEDLRSFSIAVEKPVIHRPFPVEEPPRGGGPAGSSSEISRVSDDVFGQFMREFVRPFSYGLNAPNYP